MRHHELFALVQAEKLGNGDEKQTPALQPRVSFLFAVRLIQDLQCLNFVFVQEA